MLKRLNLGKITVFGEKQTSEPRYSAADHSILIKLVEKPSKPELIKNSPVNKWVSATRFTPILESLSIAIKYLILFKR